MDEASSKGISPSIFSERDAKIPSLSDCLNLGLIVYSPAFSTVKLYLTHCPLVCHLSPPIVL